MRSLIILSLIFISPFIKAQIGTLDIDFGPSGGCYNPYVSGNSALSILEDDAIILAQYYDSDLNLNSLNVNGQICKLSPDGFLDTTFGTTNGFTNLGGPDFPFGPFDVTTLDDGSIIAVGRDMNSQTNPAVFKLNSNGIPDTDFGISGVWVPSMLSPDSVITGLFHVEKDFQNRILIAGFMSIQPTSVSRTFIMRMLADGTLDQTFGQGGFYFIPYGSSGVSEIIALSDGIIVTGSEIVGSGTTAIYSIYALKLLENGTLNVNFGTSGIHQPAPGVYQRTTDAALMPDGRIAICYYYPVGNLVNSGISMINANGTTDLTYGNSGIAVLQIPSTTFALIDDIAVFPDGSIVGAGYSINSLDQSTGTDKCLMMLNANGQPVSAFGTQGFIVNGSSVYNDNFVKVRLQSNNKIVACGAYSYLSTQTFLDDGWIGTICRYQSGFSDPTSTADLNNTRAIQIYPNPVSSEIGLINLPSSDLSRNISLTDLSGRLIFKQSLIKGSNQVQLPTELPTGVYFIWLESQDQTSTLKLIIK